MKLAEQLEILKIIYEVGDIEKFKEQYLFLKENFISESELKQMDDFVDKILKESREESDRNMEEIRLRCYLILNKEIETFNFALQDIGKKIGSIV